MERWPLSTPFLCNLQASGFNTLIKIWFASTVVLMGVYLIQKAENMVFKSSRDSFVCNSKKVSKGAVAWVKFDLCTAPHFYRGNQGIVSIGTLSKKMRRKESRYSTAFFLRIFMLQILWGRDIAFHIPAESSDAVSRSCAPLPKALFPQVHWHCLD